MRFNASHTLLFLAFLLEQKSSKSIDSHSARVCLPKIIPLYPGSLDSHIHDSKLHTLPLSLPSFKNKNWANPLTVILASVCLPEIIPTYLGFLDSHIHNSKLHTITLPCPLSRTKNWQNILTGIFSRVCM